MLQLDSWLVRHPIHHDDLLRVGHVDEDPRRIALELGADPRCPGRGILASSLPDAAEIRARAPSP